MTLANTQITFTCSKSTIEVLEKAIMVLLLLTLNIFETSF